MADNGGGLLNPASITVSEGNNGVVAHIINGDVYLKESGNKCHALIPLVIEKLSEITNIEDDDLEKQFKVEKNELKEYKIPDKINYNNVIVYQEIIDEYSEYSSICEHAFNVLDDSNMGIKRKILEYIKLMYRKVKGKLLRINPGIDQMEIIRQNSDDIIEKVIEILKKEIIADNKGKNLAIESIEVALSRIICYAFIKCKILEKPR
ncbi:portal protein [Clostridium botulinum]|nr:portal protein [Clostridium botulinum]